MPHRLIDSVDWWVVFLVTAAALWLVTEIGFRFGRRHRSRERAAEEEEEETSLERAEDEETVSQKKSSQAGLLLAALLGLLGLLLAFSFSIVESRFSTRKQLVLQEANAIGTTYLRAEMLPEPHGTRLRHLLREYVELRAVPEISPRELRPLLERSEELHFAMWEEAEVVAEAHPRSEIAGLFVASLNEVIDLHQERVTMALYYRLPNVILGTLYMVALVAMALMGYSAGLTRARVSAPVIATVVTISVVLLLVIELDRPWQRMFKVNQQALEDVTETIERIEAGH
jgi:hypothetical protein